MKEPISLLEKSYLTIREMREVVIKTTEIAPTREATEILVKILHSTYGKADLKWVENNTTQLNAVEITQLLRLLEEF